MLACEIEVEAVDGRARCSTLHLWHRGVDVPTPIFMPVGTQGTVKGLTAEELAATGCRLCLGNTYHLGHRPGAQRVAEMGGLHKAMRWPHGILTDSGGFQMVSLLSLSEVTEEGVRFTSPHDGSEQLLSPEQSIKQQRLIGSDIVMALDDVVRPHTTAPARVEEAMQRTIRWLDRCESVLPRTSNTQALYGIVQGGLHEEHRRYCAQQLVRRDLQGYAVGGLSGGESKDLFWRAVAQSTEELPTQKPRYAMGVGYMEDMLVCVALGVDQFDCVYPTRTARFGTALVRDPNCPSGTINLCNRRYAHDFTLLDTECNCQACSSGTTRASLHALFSTGSRESLAIGAQLLTHHNICHQLRLMAAARNAIREHRYASFVTDYMLHRYGPTVSSVPSWIVEALAYAGIHFSDASSSTVK